MFSKALCPGQEIPVDINDCLYQCFEAHRRQTLRRRAARKNRQPSYRTIQGSTQHQTFAEPIQTFQPSTFEYSNNFAPQATLPVDTRSNNVSYGAVAQTDIQQPTSNYYQTHEPYYQLKGFEQTAQQVTPSSTNIIEQQVPAQFTELQTTYLQPSKTIHQASDNYQYQAPVLQFYDSHITHQRSAGSSIPTGTIEYTKQAYYAQEPLSIRPNISTSYSQIEGQIQSSDNRQYLRESLPQETVQTYDQKMYTDELIVPEQPPPLSTYENDQYNFVQQTVTPKPITREIQQQEKQYIAAAQPIQSFTPINPTVNQININTPIRPQPPPSPSSHGSEGDSIEDQEIFDLRACICRCYAKFKDAWNKDQQERYEEQFHDIQKPIPPSIPPYNQQLIQQPNTFFYINCDHKAQPQQIYQTAEIHFTDASTQTKSHDVPIQNYVSQETYDQTPITFDTAPQITVQPQQEQYYQQTVQPFVQQHIPRSIPTFERIPILQPPLPETNQQIPRIDSKTGLCLVPCPETIKHAHLPPHLRPELFCTELPPPSYLPPPLPPPPPQPRVQAQQWCIKCCCVPGSSLVKKVVYNEIQDEKQQEEESYIDYASVIDQLATRVTVRYGNEIMEESETFVSGNYNEQLRIIDFPVHVSGDINSDLTPLIPFN